MNWGTTFYLVLAQLTATQNKHANAFIQMFLRLQIKCYPCGNVSRNWNILIEVLQFTICRLYFETHHTWHDQCEKENAENHKSIVNEHATIWKTYNWHKTDLSWRNTQREKEATKNSIRLWTKICLFSAPSGKRAHSHIQNEPAEQMPRLFYIGTLKAIKIHLWIYCKKTIWID